MIETVFKSYFVNPRVKHETQLIFQHILVSNLPTDEMIWDVEC